MEFHHLKIFYTNKNYTNSILYEQYNKAGELLEQGTVTNIGFGIGYFVPINEFESLVKFIDGTNVTSGVLKLPYMIVDNIGGFNSNGLFLDTGFSNFGFTGNKHSYFDLEQGVWINDEK